VLSFLVGFFLSKQKEEAAAPMPADIAKSAKA